MEKANADFEANKKELSFVGKELKHYRCSTKGKLKVLQSHDQRLGLCSVDDAKEVDSMVNECHRCSVEYDDPVLDREIDIARCVRLWESFSSMEGHTCYTSFLRWFGVRS